MEELRGVPCASCGDPECPCPFRCELERDGCAQEVAALLLFVAGLGVVAWMFS